MYGYICFGNINNLKYSGDFENQQHYKTII